MDENEEIPQSYILIQFHSTGSVLFQPTLEGVTPFQLLAVAGFLEEEAKDMLRQYKEQEKRKQEMTQIAIPGNPQVKTL
jgi:hypothetical protein